VPWLGPEMTWVLNGPAPVSWDWKPSDAYSLTLPPAVTPYYLLVATGALGMEKLVSTVLRALRSPSASTT